jgi:hypothetical protein
MLRSSPTVACDAGGTREPWSDALREDMAVQLPRKHCAFEGCSWNYDDTCTPSMAAENALVDHLMEHDNELEPFASLLPSFGSEQVAPPPGKRGRRTRAEQGIAPVEADRTRFAAAYNEAIVIAARR